MASLSSMRAYLKQGIDGRHKFEKTESFYNSMTKSLSWDYASEKSKLIDGLYEIDVKPGQTLIFSFVGFETKEVLIQPEDQEMTIRFGYENNFIAIKPCEKYF